MGSTYQLKLLWPIECLPDVFHCLIFLLSGQFHQRAFLLACFESIHKLRELGFIKMIFFIATLVKHKLQATSKLTRPIKVRSDYEKWKNRFNHLFLFLSFFNFKYYLRKIIILLLISRWVTVFNCSREKGNVRPSTFSLVFCCLTVQYWEDIEAWTKTATTIYG